MTISFVGSAGNASADGGDVTVTLPTCQEGDLVIVVAGQGCLGTDYIPVISTSGYTELAAIGDVWDSVRARLRVAYKFMGASPDASVDITGSHDAYDSTAALAYVLRGVDLGTPIDVSVTTDKGTNTGVPDCPAITPTTAGALIVAVGCGTREDTTVTLPSGYSNGVRYSAVDSAQIQVVACSKEWSGSGAENPGGWTGWTVNDIDSWCAATIALRPLNTVSPSTGVVTITGTTPAVGLAPPAGEVAVTTGTPVATTGVAVYPSSGEIAFTSAEPTLPIAVRPTSGQMRITGQVPVLQIHLRGSLVVTLPTLVFAGTTSSPSWMDVDLPALVPVFAAGAALTVDLPFPGVAFSAVMGATCPLNVDLPTLVFSAGAGAAFALDLPEFTPLFSSTTGSVASLNVTLPAFAALFSADVENLAQLVVHLPDLLPAFSSHQQVLSQLIVDLPPLSVLFSGSAGEAASLHVTLPELQVLLTSYEEITGQMVVVLPALKALFSAAQSGRFDTTTALQLDGTVLRYRRPV